MSSRLWILAAVAVALLCPQLALAQGTCEDGSAGDKYTNAPDHCSWYNSTNGCCGDVTTNPPPVATLSEGYGATACDTWELCHNIVAQALCGYHCRPYWANGKFQLCSDFVDRIWTACKTAGTFTTSACVTNEQVGLTRDTYLTSMLGTFIEVVNPADPAKPAESCFNSAQTIAASIAGIVAAVLLVVVF